MKKLDDIYQFKQLLDLLSKDFQFTNQRQDLSATAKQIQNCNNSTKQKVESNQTEWAVRTPAIEFG